MKYQVKEAGQVRGPFEVAELREMIADGRVTSAALFRRVGWEDWIAACDLEDDIATGDCAPPAPVVSRPPPLPSSTFPVKFFGLTTGQCILLAFGVIVALLTINYAVNHEEIARKMAQDKAAKKVQAAQEREESERRAQVWKVKELGRNIGRADGAEIGAAGGRKPSLDAIRLLCVSRAIANGIDKLDKERIAAFWSGYEAAFKDAYKGTADW